MKAEIVPGYLEVYFSYDEKLNKLRITVSGEYIHSNHKNQLYVNENHFVSTIDRWWDKAKRQCKPLDRLIIDFDQIDWYDSMTDMYTTPYFVIKRPNRKTIVSKHSWGDIPKDWIINYLFIFKFTPTSRFKAIEELLSDFLDARCKPFEKHLRSQLKAIKKGILPETYIEYNEN